MRMISIAAVALVLAGCSSSPPVAHLPTAEKTGPTASLQSAVAYQKSLPKCSAVFKAGIKVTAKGASPTQIDCNDPDGTTQIIPLTRCGDGSHLGSVEPRTGAPRGWFFYGQAFHLVKGGEIAADKGYGAAYRKCNG